MIELQCHSGTKKEEIIEFLQHHKGKHADILLETNLYPQWGDDWVLSVELHETGMKSAIETVNECYIHNVKIL